MAAAATGATDDLISDVIGELAGKPIPAIERYITFQRLCAAIPLAIGGCIMNNGVLLRLADDIPRVLRECIVNIKVEPLVSENVVIIKKGIMWPPVCRIIDVNPDKKIVKLAKCNTARIKTHRGKYIPHNAVRVIHADKTCMQFMAYIKHMQQSGDAFIIVAFNIMNQPSCYYIPECSSADAWISFQPCDVCIANGFARDIV
jgi:hypothetical protein